MEEYIKFRLKQLENKSVAEQYESITQIYEELEQRGYHHSMIYATINEIILKNLNQLKKKLNDQLEGKFYE